MQERFRALIKSKREKKGYTQEQMAKKLNYKSKSSYNFLENGPTSITLEMLEQIFEIIPFTKKEKTHIFFGY